MSFIRSSRDLTTSLRWSFRYWLRVSSASYSSPANGLTCRARRGRASPSPASCAVPHGHTNGFEPVGSSPPSDSEPGRSLIQVQKCPPTPRDARSRPARHGRSGPKSRVSSSMEVRRSSDTFCVNCPNSPANRSRSTSSSCSRRCSPATFGSMTIALRRAFSAPRRGSMPRPAAPRAWRSHRRCSPPPGRRPARHRRRCAALGLRLATLFMASMCARRCVASAALSRNSPACRFNDSTFRSASVPARSSR